MRIFYNVLELMVSAKSLSAERRKLSENAEISNHYRKYSVRMRIFYNVLEMMVSAKSPSAERRKLSLNAEISKQVYIITIENMGRGLLWPAIGRSSAYRRLSIGALGRLSADSRPIIRSPAVTLPTFARLSADSRPSLNGLFFIRSRRYTVSQKLSADRSKYN